MEDAIKIISTKFSLSDDFFKEFDTSHVSLWFVELSNYLLENDKRNEDEKLRETSYRKERLNNQFQLSQLEKQVILGNSKIKGLEKTTTELRASLQKKTDAFVAQEDKFSKVKAEVDKLSHETEKFQKEIEHIQSERNDLMETVAKKSKEVDRLNQEWYEMSEKLNEANKLKYELQYKCDEMKNSDILCGFKETRLEQEKTMLNEQVEELKKEMQDKTQHLMQSQKANSTKLFDLESKHEISVQENIHLKSNLQESKKLCSKQEEKLNALMEKLKRVHNDGEAMQENMQQELSAQTKLVQLYKEDRDHGRKKLEEMSSAISELQNIVSQLNEEKSVLNARLTKTESESLSRIEELTEKNKTLHNELSNSNELLQLSKKKGHVEECDISSLSPIAAATSAILKKGMTLTQIYGEYVKLSDKLLAEKDENNRLKMYMDQILQEVEEKAPMLLQQKQDYEQAVQSVQSLSVKLEENIKHCHELECQESSYKQTVNFYKREEKRLKTLSADLTQQVRALLHEVEQKRAHSTTTNSGEVISEHLVSFKNIEELQSQNQRLLVTVRELSEAQEKIEAQGGAAIIEELKEKIAAVQNELQMMKENDEKQQEMMSQVIKQRNMYKVLCQSGHIANESVISVTSDASMELNKVKADLDSSVIEFDDYKSKMCEKVKTLNEKIDKDEEEISAMKMQVMQQKNQVDLSAERLSIITSTLDGFKKEHKALEVKSNSISEAFNKSRVEGEKYKQENSELKEKLMESQMSSKMLRKEKVLMQESEKRLMEENKTLLDQQQSQNILLSNFQSIQNNMERQEFETRKTLSKQCESLQSEMKAIRKNYETEHHILKNTAADLGRDLKEVRMKLEVETEKRRDMEKELMEERQHNETLRSKCEELEKLSQASNDRLEIILNREKSEEDKDKFVTELEQMSMKAKQLEIALLNAKTERNALDEQLGTLKKHLEQYQEIGDSNEEAITIVTKAKEKAEVEFSAKIKSANEHIENYKKQVAEAVAEKNALKKQASENEKEHQNQLSEMRGQMAPLERRFQEVTRALVLAKESEQRIVKESQAQSELSKETQEKYERELLLHANDVEQLMKLKDKLSTITEQHSGVHEQVTELQKTLTEKDQLINEMKKLHKNEIEKDESAKENLREQNAILHRQLGKVSTQLSQAVSISKRDEKAPQGEKDLEDVYELLRYVRREKEIAETHAEVCRTESLRYRQRLEHLQKDYEETKQAYSLELERTQGHMLSEDEHKNLIETVKREKESAEIVKNLEKEKTKLCETLRSATDQNKKFEVAIKELSEQKKSLETEKNVFMAEKSTLKSEIERWSARANQLIAHNAVMDSEEVKKLKSQNEKVVSGLQEELRRNKQQVEALKKEAMKLRNENNKQTAESETNASSVGKLNAEAEKELELLKAKNAEMAEKSKMVRKVARKYKTQSDHLQKLLKDNNIDFKGVISSASMNTGGQGGEVETVGGILESEERKKMEQQLAEKSKVVEDLSKQLAALQTQLATENKNASEQEKKILETQQTCDNAEKKFLEKVKEYEALKAQSLQNKKKLEEVQERNKKLLKTCKDKLSSLSKLKESSSKEIDALKKQLKNVHDEQNNVSTEQKNAFNSVRAALEVKLSASVTKVEALQTERDNLLENVNKLQRELEKSNGDKIKGDTSLLKSTSEVQVCETSAPLTATVRPTATPASQTAVKFHLQSTPTASIRPLAHAHPTAMVSPTIPETSSVATPVASVTALPVSATVPPQMAEVQGRTSRTVPFKAPVARVVVQSREESDVVPNIDIVPTTSSATDDELAAVPSLTKRTREETVEENNDAIDIDEPNTKKQKMSEQTIQSVEEDQLLSEENIEDNNDLPVTEQASVTVLHSTTQRESELQLNRQLQPSPQELLRQRQTIAGRSQLPSFSLISGQGSSSGFYEETDDSMVPSTPTLYKPKLSDGFAEAVSFPVARFPAFSFPSNDQPSSEVTRQPDSEVSESAGEDTVPLTPLSVVPTGSVCEPIQSSNQSLSKDVVAERFFVEEGNLQHVPQQDEEKRESEEKMLSEDVNSGEDKEEESNVKTNDDSDGEITSDAIPTSSSAVEEAESSSKCEEGEKPKPVRLQRSTRGLRSKLRRKPQAGECSKKSDA